MKQPNKDMSFLKVCNVIHSCKTVDQLKVAAKMASHYIRFCSGTMDELKNIIFLIGNVNQIIEQEVRLKRKTANIKVNEFDILRS